MQSRNREITKVSDFCKRLKPVGRILEIDGWHVWGCSPIDGPDGKIHVFFSRWPADSDLGGWLTHCEIGHAVAEDPAGPYVVLDIALKGRGGKHWDAVTIHNPTVHKVDDIYALFYMGNSDGTVDTQRVGLAISDSLNGPWERVGDIPAVNVSSNREDWDSYITTNPAFLKHPDGQFWLYYKAWDRYNDNLRKIGLATADRIEGPYRKHPGNPLVDFSTFNQQAEDPYVFMEDNRFHLLLRDMGVIDKHVGIYMASDDGIYWSKPMLGYRKNSYYFEEKTRRFERPQVLMRNEHPAYLFLGLRDGKYGACSGAVLEVG